MEQESAPGKAVPEENNGVENRSASPPGEHGSTARAGAPLRSASLAQSSLSDQLGICNMLAAILYGVSTRDFTAYTRNERRVNESRQLGMYLANICLGIAYEDIASVTNRDRTTVRYSIERVEDRRENPQFDSVLVALETLIGCFRNREVADMIENGLNIDYNLVSHVPRADHGVD